MNDITVQKALFMDGANFKNVDLGSAQIGGQLNLRGSTFEGELDMNGISVDHGLFMDEEATFKKDVNLISAKIGDQLSMSSSQFVDSLYMNVITVDEALFMNEGSAFNDVNLIGARIGGQLTMRDSKFEGKLIMESIIVGQHLLMDNVKFTEEDVNQSTKEINLGFSNIEGGLQLSGSTLPTIRLTGTKISQVFAISESYMGKEFKPEWHYGAKLILRNTEVGAIQDTPDAWSDELDLEGFRYKQLGGFQIADEQEQTDQTNKKTDERIVIKIWKYLTKTTVEEFINSFRKKEIPDDITKRPSSWFIEWLAKDMTYSPQPYEQLGKVLRESGHKDKADDVLFESKERERKGADLDLYTKIKLCLEKIFVGYGYDYRYSIAWVIGLIIIGTLVCFFGFDNVDFDKSIIFSIDSLLPIPELLPNNTEIKTSSWFPEYYFYFHKIMGAVLAIYVTAALAGITKK